MKPYISVALCADKNIEVGLHVTLHSLLQNSHHFIKIYFLQKGYLQKDIAKLHKTLEKFNGNYELKIIDFDDRIFSKFRGLYGSKFTYTRIMLADLISEERIIYLDSDLVIKKDLGSLFFTDLKGFIIGASGVEKIEWTLDSDFFTSIGLDKEGKYFNAGVLLIDLQAWRQEDITKKCFEFANKYLNKFRDADQAILNYIFYKNNFYELDASYNHALYPGSKQKISDVEDSIFHFIGSPKPWDLFGETIHGNYPLFHEVLTQTACSSYKTFLDFSPYRIKRTLRLARSYYNCLKNRAK